MNDFPILSVLIFLPIAGALLLALIPGERVPHAPPLRPRPRRPAGPRQVVRPRRLRRDAGHLARPLHRLRPRPPRLPVHRHLHLDRRRRCRLHGALRLRPRRPLGAAGPADHLPHDRRRAHLLAHRPAPQGVLRLAAGARGLRPGRLHRPRPAGLLPLLGARVDPDVPAHLDLGARRAAALLGAQVRPLHRLRLGLHAGRLPDPGRHGRLVRHARHPRRRPLGRGAAAAGGVRLHPHRLRRQAARRAAVTPGCPTRTPTLPPLSP